MRVKHPALIAVLALAVGCAASQEAAQEAEALTIRVADLEKEKARLERENDALHAETRKLNEELERQRQREVFTRLGVEEGQNLSAKLVTSLGAITCELWPATAPQTVLNFVELAEGSRNWTDPTTGRKTNRPLYTGTIFHRVIPNFMIQGGDPLGDGTGGPGYRFEDETSPEVTFDEPGLLAMANSGPNTNGSQFFITDRATPTHLNGKHTIFGKCGDLDVVEAIATTPTGARDKPLKDAVIDRVEITRP